MGCDIHLFVERRVDGKWVTADKWKIDPEDGDNVARVNYDERFYSDRNYDLFAILANVRNGRGFAGVKTGEGFVPMCEPRGIPEDACPQVQVEAASWSSDGHSHSHLTVAEIMAYDWTQTTKLQGWVTRKQYARYKINGAPTEWMSGVSGGNVRHVSNAEMEALDINEKTGKYDPWAQYHANETPFGMSDGSIYTQVSWEIPYYHAGATFLSEVLPRLWRLGRPEEVRIVFFFDN